MPPQIVITPDETVLERHLPSRTGIGIAVLLGLAGFGANWFNLPLLFNVDYIFGSFFVMLAIQLLGWRLGTLTGLLAGSCSWLLWNHPYAIIIFTLEALVTGLMYERRRGDLLLSNAIYWLFIGMPLVLLFYAGVMKIGSDGTMALMFKQAINGIANAMAARLAVTALQHQPHIKALLPFPASLREILSTLLSFFAICSALLLLAVHSRYQARATEQMIVMMLKGTGLQATTLYQNQPHTKNHEYLRAFIRSTRNNPRLHYTLLDRNNNVLERSRPELPLQELPQPGDPRLQPVRDGVMRWIPDSRPNIAVSERWKRSAYLLELRLGDDLRLQLLAPTAPWLPPLNTTSARALAITLGLVLFTTLVGGWLSNRITRSLRLLGNATTSLPSDLDGSQRSILPNSSIPEVARLTGSFKAMSDELATRFSALKTARALLAQIETAERSRISRELHDGVAQSLQGVKMNLQILISLATDGKPYNPSVLGELVQEIGDASDELRDLILALRPTLLESMGLPEAIRWLADTVSRRTGIDISVDYDCISCQFTGPLAVNLFRICQEAITNSIRHSQATSIDITLSCTEHNGALIIGDNGRGGAAPTDQGFGLKIMRERVELCNGIFTLLSPPGQGTEIIVEVPLL